MRRSPLTRVLSALGDPVRTRILDELAGGPLTVTDLCARLCALQPSVSHHLAVLRREELVADTKRGRFVEYARTDLATRLLAAAREIVAEYT